jgi:fumarate reductase subunit C
MSPRPYVRGIKRGWWLRRPRYLAYMVRELTSLFVALYSALLVLGLARLAQGPAAWDGFLVAVSTPGGLAFQLICLLFAIYHSVTWFAVTPKAMPLMLKGEPVAAGVIVGAHYVVWLAISFGVIFAAAG